MWPRFYTPEMRPAETIDTCTAAHERLRNAIGELTDDDSAQPSLLPGWSRGYVLTHLAHKTATHVRLFEGAQANEVRDQYPHGFAQAQADVHAGAGRSAAELREELTDSFADLQVAWAKLPDSYWDREGICVPGPRSMQQIVSRHLRDVEVHYVDLDIGYRPTDWPELFVEGELAKRLAGLPDRTSHAALLAWLLGRAGAPTLGPW
jgi:maleylpyruvate isomerase